jgi:putative ABC transport system permease protein
MRGFLQDVRYALRQLRKNAGFTAVAVITLALGIGANTAIFSVVDGVLLRPLPFHNPERLVRVWHVPPPQSFPGLTTFSVSAANYLDWESQNHVFEQMAIYTGRSFTLTGGQTPEEVIACPVSSEFFATLGIQPLLGRTLLPEENQLGRSNVVVLSYPFWQQYFGARPGIVGRTVVMDGRNFLVAGVMPPNFRYPDFAQMWTPMAWTDQQRRVRGEHHYGVIARLKPGVDLKSAQAEMNTISSRLAQLYPADDKGWGAIVIPLHDDMVRDVRPALLVLLGAVTCVLLIACGNVANLILTKGFSREKEIAIRTALGASSARVLRQILTESVLLSVAGGALGLVYARFGMRLIVKFLADKLPQSSDIRLDSEVLGFTLAISLLTGVLAGILPALRLARRNISQKLKQGLGRTDADSGGHGTRNALVIAEVSLSLILLVGAGLLIRSFQRLHQVNPGFQAHGVLTANVKIGQTKFSGPADQVRFFEQVLTRVRAMPAVVAAGVSDDIPLNYNGSVQPIAIEGRPVVAMSDQPEVDVRVISPGYMSALRIPVLRGRDFNDTDVSGRTGAVLISKSMAREFWPGEDAIGKRLTMTFFPGIVREVVGVVGDVKVDGLDQTRPATTLYMPLGQISAPANGGWSSFPMTIVVRTATNPASLGSAVANAVHQVDSAVPVGDILTMDDVVAVSLTQPRFDTLLLGSFAVLALVLAAVGIYSVLSYSVRRRSNEIGIRMALGAGLNDVLQMVIVEGMKPTLLGLVLGMLGALALGRVISKLIYGVTPRDPLTLFAVGVLLSSVALFACYIPARRAAKVDPIVALRYE